MSDPAPEVRVIGWATVTERENGDREIPGIDPGRLRRMDRFGRSGFLAGSLALIDGGFVKPAAIDPRVGVVFGTAYGCRDSITDHASLLAGAAAASELRPALFAQTVHNSVCGELSIEWRLGGISETILTGCTAGLEAIIMAARQIEAGAADRAVAGGGEGLHEAMRKAFAGERSRFGARGRSASAEESAAALYLVRDGVASASRARARYVCGKSFFEPHPSEARTRLFAWAREEAGEPARWRMFLASPDLEGAFEGVEGLVCEKVQRFGASGPFTLVSALKRAREGERVVVLVRDPDGPCAGVAFDVAS